MISEDITNHTTFTTEKVNLSFIHLLSRLNIGVRKATPILDDFDVKLKSVTVFNMYSNGKFDESTAANAAGNNSRWGVPSNTRTKFEDGVGYDTETELTSSYNYVYQALAIPQTVDYESGIKLDGSNINKSTSKPYLTISYEIWAKQVLYKEGDTDIPEGKQVGDERTPTTLTGAYEYTYNLADLFNGDGATTNVDFNEGWMNTLKITINPEAIEFDADVYEWAPETPVEVDVPDANPGN